MRERVVSVMDQHQRDAMPEASCTSLFATVRLDRNLCEGAGYRRQPEDVCPGRQDAQVPKGTSESAMRHGHAAKAGA